MSPLLKYQEGNFFHHWPPKLIFLNKLLPAITLILIVLSFLLITSICFALTNHPLPLGLLVIAHATGVCLLTTSTWHSLAWFSYILFLIFLGAIIVLFTYITSLAANELFYTPRYQPLRLIILILILILNDYLLLPINFVTPDHQCNPHTPLKQPEEFIALIFRNPFFSITLFLACYLLLSLLIVVRLTSKTSGPVRSS